MEFLTKELLEKSKKISKENLSWLLSQLEFVHSKPTKLVKSNLPPVIFGETDVGAGSGAASIRCAVTFTQEYLAVICYENKCATYLPLDRNPIVFEEDTDVSVLRIIGIQLGAITFSSEPETVIDENGDKITIGDSFSNFHRRFRTSVVDRRRT